MKKILTIIGLITALALSGCSYFTEEDGVSQTPENPGLMEKANASESTKIQQTKKSFEYTNTKYGFSLTFPASWGKIVEKVVPVTMNDKELLFQQVQLTSSADLKKVTTLQRTAWINVVDKKVNMTTEMRDLIGEYTHSLLRENNQYAYYASFTLFYGMPGEDTEEHRILSEEISRVKQTFRLESSPTKETSKNETSDWQTYKNDKYGFEVKHPKNAKAIVSPKGGGIVYIGTSGSEPNEYNYGITVNFLGSANNTSAENWYLQYYQDKKQEATKADVPFQLSASGKNVLLNGYTAYKTVDSGMDRGIVHHYMVHNKNIVVLTYEDQSANDPQWNEHKKMIEQILSTFQFTKANDPITYSTKGIPVIVTKTTAPFYYTTEGLMSSECEGIKSKAYYDQLIAKFNGTTITTYHFKYTGESDDSDTYKVTLLPNKAGYTTMDQFSDDFGQCFAGGDAYPNKMNNNWLLFADSCGSGAGDPSGLPNGCNEVKKVVEPTFKLN